MKATAFEFRFRFPIMVAVICLGYWSPWSGAWGAAALFTQRISLLEWLALEISRLNLVTFTVATPIVIGIGTLFAAIGAWLRIWGTAYLGSATMLHGQMQAGAVMADGPYRFVRNPLYIGSWFMVAAMCFTMPPTGALMTIVAISIFQLRLIYGEEAFLSTQLGQPYLDYLHTVPRLIPMLRSTLPSTDRKPNWTRALIAEVNPIGVFVVLAALSWTYNNELMVRAILVAFGLSLIVRALVPGIRQPVT
jgi:protein-S-isoprenylcysteine O-methyltransferase Ste14